MARPQDGNGMVYKRGEVWWIKFYLDGKAVYESAKSKRMADAQKLLRQRIGQRERKELSQDAHYVTIGSLLENVLDATDNPDTRKIRALVINNRLKPFFGDLKAESLTTAKMKAYRVARLKDGVKDATVNRELSLVRSAFYLGRKQTPPLVNVVPYFPMVKETFVREGFLDDDDYAKLLSELPEHIQTIFAVAYATGVRRKELLSVEWQDVDFELNLLTIRKTKNGERRTVPIIAGDMRELLRAAKRKRDNEYPEVTWVFTRNGSKMVDFRQGWDDACDRAGLPDLTFHDLRRTAVRNMRRAGVPQVVRMKISGHKTDSMERRYNIVDVDDLEIAAEFMARAAEKRTMKKEAGD